ncbi:MAG: dTMP kinase [Planctomycetota bacterium]
MPLTGKLIVFEGGDGTGKTTQALRFLAFLESVQNAKPLHIREPGSTALGEKIREILITPCKDPQEEITAEAEMLLYMSCRAQLFKTIIRPALYKGKTVVLERSFYSTYAYQGLGLGLDAELILLLGRSVSQGIDPYRVILLDMPVSASLSRLGSKKDRIESRDYSFHERVRQGYLQVAGRYPALFKIIDATGNPEEVEARIHAVFNDIL